MSNPIQNVNQLNALTSLSSYEVKGDTLHQIGGLHQLARQVADFFRNMTSDGARQIAERNFRVSAQIHELIRGNAEVRQGAGAAGQTINLQQLVRHNLNALIALNEKVNASNLSVESRKIINSVLENRVASFQSARTEQSALQDSKIISSIDNYIFNKVDTTFNEEVNGSLKSALTQDYVTNLHNINYLNESFSKDIYRNGINSFMGHILSYHGIDGAIEAKSYGLNHAINLRQEFEQRLEQGKDKNTLIDGVQPEQLKFFEEMLKDFLSTNDNSAIDKNYRAYAPFVRSVLDQRGITGWIGGPQLASAIGLWEQMALNQADISMRLKVSSLDLNKSDGAYNIEVRGVINTQCLLNGDVQENGFREGTVETLGVSTFTAKLKIPMGQLLPADENPPRVSNEPFIPEFSVDLRFHHSIE